MGEALTGVVWSSVILASAAFFINHWFSYQKNKETDSKKIKNIGHMLFFPYVRIVPMHLIIVFGFFLLGGPISLVLFLVLKTIADVIMHSVEHR